MLRIIFMGSPEFAIPGLDKLASSGHRILAVASNPDKRRGRGSELSPTPVKGRALDLDIPVIDVNTVTDPDFIDTIKQLEPDLLVVVAFRILPPEVLEIPRLGSINLHASLLPEYRGAAPIHWAVINGETKTGCTVFFLNERVDTGTIINQVQVPIGPDDTTGDVYDRLKKAGAELLLHAIDQIDQGKTEGKPQDERLASTAPKLFIENTRIDFTDTAQNVHNKIRGLSPFPGAWTTYKGEKMNLYRSKIGPDIELNPGHLHLHDQRLYTGCGKGTVELTEVQLPGRKRMTGTDFANGYDLSVVLV